LPSLTEAWPSLELYPRRPQRSLYLCTPHGTNLYDVDLTSAYTTAMAMIRVPDWEICETRSDIGKARSRIRGHDFARVRFSFPEGTRFPALPVRAGIVVWFIR